MQEQRSGQETPVEPPLASPSPIQESPSKKWQCTLGIALALIGAIDEVNEAIFGDRRNVMMFPMLLAGVLAGRAIDKWKDRTLYHGLYFVPLGILLGLAAWALFIGPLP